MEEELQMITTGITLDICICFGCVAEKNSNLLNDFASQFSW